MARQMSKDNQEEASPATLFYNYKTANFFSRFDSDDSSGSQPKAECYIKVCRFARIMFPEFFVKTSTEICMKASETASSKPAVSSGLNKAENNYWKLDKEIKIWLIKEYGLVTS